jgi:hypothetical protein
MKIITSYPIIDNGVDITPNLYYENASGEDFYDASGEDFYDASGEDFYDASGEDFYDASGKRRRRKKSSGGGILGTKRGEGTFGTVVKNLFSKEAIAGRQKNRAEKRRLEAAKPKKETTKAVEKTPEVVKEEVKVEETMPIMAAPVAQTPIVEAPKGMSKGAKIGIAVGIVAVLGVVGFMVYKKTSLKNK